MKKFLLSTILVIFAVAVGWYYTPQALKKKVAAFIGIAASHDTGEIKNFLGDILLPQDPQERREVLIRELRKNISKIKERTIKIGKDEKTTTPTEKFDIETTEEIISSSEEIIKELEESNNDKSLGQEVGERVLDIVFPVELTREQCREISK